MKIAFVTNFCPHYRIRTFETLARYADVDYYFFSAGDEWYWQQQHGIYTGDFHYQYLPGYRLGGTRLTPALPWKLWETDYDLYIKCINGRFALPMTYLMARAKRKPFVLWTGIWMRLQTPAHRLFFPITRSIYRHADALVVYGEHVKRYLVGEGVPAERIFIAHHAVDNPVYQREISAADKRQLREHLGIGTTQQVLLYLGRLETGKGLSYLLEAFARITGDAVLVIAGDGAERSRLERQAAELGIADRVRFAGYVPADQAVVYYALASVCVLPSVTTSTFKEPWGLVVNEAFNQGVPVVTTEAVGAAAGGLVQEAGNGYIVPEKNSAVLAARIQQILNRPDLRQRLGEEARRTVAGWDNQRMVQGFRQAADYVLRSPKR